ncbi:MAG: ABC transporter substrate-binding protein [Roseiarcus sp.]|jgi:putative thiamine transport system substrate-binding protein
MKRLIYALSLGLALFGAAASARADAAWDAVMANARGQTVYWNAWGGDERTNNFIAWVGAEVQRRYGVELRQVKLTDTGEAVARVVAEKGAGRGADGSVDMIWINGPNFLSMKEKGLLYGPFADKLPNAAYVDTTNKLSNVTDFTIPVDGMESPWRLAQFVFIDNSARVPEAPRTLDALAQWIKAHPGRFTHPDPKDFMGASFLKQILVDLAPDPDRLASPATDADFAAETAPLWAWYDALRPSFWRRGEQFPADGPAQLQLLNDGELDFALSFDPAEAAAAVEAGRLPASVRVYTLAGGAIGNTSFVAIPYNSPHKEGAMVVANFLLDPATQAHAQDIHALGAFTVLDLTKLSSEQQRLFADLPSNPALPTSAELGKVLLEPHPSWMTRITAEWRKRYAQ